MLLCFTDNTHNVLCVTYGKENITMTELKATAPKRASKKAIPASEPYINITDNNAPLEIKEREQPYHYGCKVQTALTKSIIILRARATRTIYTAVLLKCCNGLRTCTD